MLVPILLMLGMSIMAFVLGALVAVLFLTK